MDTVGLFLRSREAERSSTTYRMRGKSVGSNVFIALGTQQAMCTCHVVTCGPSGSTTFSHFG